MKIKTLILSFMALLLIAGCNDDDKSSETFSPLTPEEHKANLETTGIDVVNQLDEISNSEAIQVVNDFVDLLESTGNYESDVMTVMESVASLQNGAGMAFNLKSSIVDEESLGQLFEDEAGIYTYNPDTQSWDKEESTDEITYHFPVDESETNNATISVTNFSYTTTTNPDLSEISDMLLESVDASLTVDDAELILLEFRASYDGDGIPASVSEELTLGEHNISTSLTRSNSKVAFDQSFKYNDDNILSSHFEMRGDLNYDNVLDEADGYNFDPYDQSVLDYINAWVLIGNIKMEGIIDWKGFENDVNNVNGNNLDSEQEVMEKMAELINDNANLKLKYNDSNEIIAVYEAYAFPLEDDSEGYWDLGFRVKFSDESYMDDSFFSKENFSDLMDSIDDLMTSVEGDYNAVQ